MNSQAYIAEIFRFFVGFIFICAAIGKLKTFSEFARNLTESFGLTAWVSQKVSPLIIATELLLACLILLNIKASYFAMLVSLCMFSVFTCVVGYQYFREGIVKCSCFGEADRSVSVYDLLRNLIVMACMVFYLLCSVSPGNLGLGMNFLTSGLAIIITIIAIQFHEIIALLFRGA